MRTSKNRRHTTRLIATVVAAIGFALSSQSALAAECPDADTAPSALDVPRAQASILCLLNEARTQHGLAALRQERHLKVAAQRYSTSMKRLDFFAHTAPTGSTPASRIARTGYMAHARRWTIGENLAWGEDSLGTPRSIVQAWLASPEHRHNMLSSVFRQIGIGVVIGSPIGADGPGAAIYTTEFGLRRR
jgi:uncharacterized protein YkwD